MPVHQIEDGQSVQPNHVYVIRPGRPERLQAHKLEGATAVRAVANPATFALSPEMALCTALDGFLREQATILPVTPGQWRNNLIGEVSQRDVLLAIQDRLTYPK